MNAEQLSRVGEKLVKRCGSRDPFEIARQLGIMSAISSVFVLRWAVCLQVATP